MAKKHRFESASLQHLYDKYVDGKAELETIFDEELSSAKLAHQLYMLRKRSKLVQAQVAELADTSTSVISRLENPEYDGHSLTTLKKVAAIYGHEVRLQFVPKSHKLSTTKKRKKAGTKAPRKVPA